MEVSKFFLMIGMCLSKFSISAAACAGLRQLQNGRTFFRYGGIYATFVCNSGYRLMGSTSSSCVRGQWRKPAPVCVASGCQRVGGLLHGRLVTSYSGAVITFMCNKGYKLCGSSVIYCDGRTWNGTKPVCREYDMMSMKEKAQVTNEKLMVGVTSNLRKPTGHTSSTEQNIHSHWKARNNTITSTALNPSTANHIIPKDGQDSSQLITISSNVNDSQTNQELVHKSKMKTLLYSLRTSLPTTKETASVTESHKVNGVESSAFHSTMNQIPTVSVSPRWSKQLSPVTTIATPNLASKDQFFGTDYDEMNHDELMIKNKSNLFGPSSLSPYEAHTTRTLINVDTEPTSTTTPASATDTTQSLHSRLTSSYTTSSNISYIHFINKIMNVTPEIVANSSTLEQIESLGSTSSPLYYSGTNSSSINDKNLPGEGNFPTSRSAPIINTIQAQALSITHFHSSAAPSDGVMPKNNSNRFDPSSSSPYESHTTRTFINSNTALTSTTTPGSATETTQFLQSRNTSSDVSKILNDDRRKAKINAPSSNTSYMHVYNKIIMTVIPDTSTLEQRKIPGPTSSPSSNITSSSSVKDKSPPGESNFTTSRSAPVITTVQAQALSPTHYHSSPVSSDGLMCKNNSYMFGLLLPLPYKTHAKGTFVNSDKKRTSIDTELTSINTPDSATETTKSLQSRFTSSNVSKMVYDDSYQTMINTTLSNISYMHFLNKIMTAIPELTANTSTLKQREILGSTSSPSTFYIGTSSSLIKQKNLVNEGNFLKSGFAPVLTTAQTQALSATLFHPSAVASDGLVLKSTSNIFEPSSSSSSSPQYKGHTTRTLLVSDTELTSTATPNSAQGLHLRFTSSDVNRMVNDRSQAKKNASLPNSLYFHFLNKKILTEIREMTANTSTLEQRKNLVSTSSPSSYSGTSSSSIQYNNLPAEGNFPTSGSAPVITTAQAQTLSDTHFHSSAAPSDSVMLTNNIYTFGSSLLSPYEAHTTRTFIHSNTALTSTTTPDSATKITQSLPSRFTGSDVSKMMINTTQSNTSSTSFLNKIIITAIPEITANTATLTQREILESTSSPSYSGTNSSSIKDKNLPDEVSIPSGAASVITTAQSQALSSTQFHSSAAPSDNSHMFVSSLLSTYEIHTTRTFINSNKALTSTATPGSALKTSQSLQSRFTSSNMVNDRLTGIPETIANTSTLVKKQIIGRTSLTKSNNLPDEDNFSASNHAPVLTTAHTQPLSTTHSPASTSTRKSAATSSSNVGNLGVITLKPKLLEQSYNSSAPRHNVVYKTTVMQKTLLEKTENVQTFRTETESKAPKVTTTLAKAIHYLHSGSQRKYFRRKRYCTYPPVPTHGTFRFLTMTDPSPYQYQYYIQYICYPGYIMSQGDIFSFCLDNGMWTGITPVCEEAAPCSINNGGCSQICKSHGEGQTECGCKIGFQLLSDMKTCKDIDECSSKMRLCEHTCTNTFGSFQCGCWKGFTLTEGGRTCIPYT